MNLSSTVFLSRAVNKNNCCDICSTNFVKYYGYNEAVVCNILGSSRSGDGSEQGFAFASQKLVAAKITSIMFRTAVIIFRVPEEFFFPLNELLVGP